MPAQGAPAADERLFLGEADCVSCHVHGTGDMVGARQTPAELKSDLAAHGPEIPAGYRQGEANLSGGQRLVGFVRN